MRRHPWLIILAGVAFATSALMPRAQAQDERAAEKLLPPNVYLYASVPDVDALKQRVEDSSLGALLHDPALDDLKEHLRQKIQSKAGKIKEDLGVSFEQLLAVPSGELAFAVCDLSGSVGVVAFIEYADSEAETVDTLIAKAESELEAQGAIPKDVEFEGTPITVYQGLEEEGEDSSSSASDLPELDIEGDEGTATGPEPFSGTIAWFRKDGWIVVGNGAPVLEAVLARWDGQHSETFAGNEVYSYISQKVQSDDRTPAFVWFIDPMGAVQTFLQSAEGLPPQFQMAAGMMPLLGLTSLQGVGGGADLATSRFNSVNNTFIYVEPPPGGNLGLLALFQLLPSELQPPSWVSQQVTAYVGANWDVAGAVEAARRLTDTFQGPGAFDRLMEQAAQAEGGPKIHPVKDLLDHLTGIVHLANYPIDADPDATSPPAQPTVVALEVSDTAAIKDVLAKLADTPNFPGTTRSFEGTTLYELPTGTANQGPLALTVANGCLMFSSKVKRLEAILRSSSATPLTETETYQRVSGYFPDEELMISFQDQEDQAKVVYQMFRKGALGEQFQGLDTSTLPPFEEIAQYMRSGGGYALADERGALFVSFTLKEEGE